MRTVLFLLWCSLLTEARADDTAKTCFPDCSPGYVCHPLTGVCVEACNPPCPSGSRCSADHTCAAIAPATTPLPASFSTGTGRVCVTRKFNFVGSALRWGIALDGDTIGTVGAGNQQCFDAAAGTHKLTLSVVAEGTGTIQSSTTVTVAAQATTSLEARMSGSTIVFQ